MINFAIDATFTPHGGSLVHLEEFIKEISKKSNIKIILLVKKENIKIINESVLDKCSIQIIKIASYGNIFRIFWSQFILPFKSIINKTDVLFCPGNFSPILKTTKVKAQWIATIGPFSKDMYKGEDFKGKLKLYFYKWIMLLSCLSSNIVVHQAEYSKQLFEDKYGFKKRYQYLIQCGKDKFFNTDIKLINIKKNFNDFTENDFLCVSHLYPYKNIERLIWAFKYYIKESSTKSKLFIVGKKMSHKYYLKLQDLVNTFEIKDRVIFTGMASKEELKVAYIKCKLFIFPSLCESSGYTLIEAMSCGAPILASNKTAIPFTCKYAAKYFDAYDQNDILLRLKTLMANENEINLMKRKSLKRASEMIDYKTATNIFLDIIETYV